MKKIIYASLLLCAIVLAPAMTNAQSATDTFSVSLGYGSTNTAEVKKLQSLLIDLGFLKASATGGYFGLTQKAVQAFQTAHGIEATGYFGPLTRAAANTAVVATASGNANQISNVSLSSSSSNAAGVILSGSKTVTWQTQGYPAGVGVNINLIRKMTVGSTTQYVLVRQLAKDTPNDGKETWIPQANETSKDLYVEVTCSTTYNFKGPCYMTNGLTPAN